MFLKYLRAFFRKLFFFFFFFSFPLIKIDLINKVYSLFFIDSYKICAHVFKRSHEEYIFKVKETKVDHVSKLKLVKVKQGYIL